MQILLLPAPGISHTMKSFIIVLATKWTIPVLQICVSCSHTSTHHSNFIFITLFLRNASLSHTLQMPPTSLLRHYPTHNVPTFLSSFYSLYSSKTCTTSVLGKQQFLYKLNNQKQDPAELSFPHRGVRYWKTMKKEFIKKTPRKWHSSLCTHSSANFSLSTAA